MEGSMVEILSTLGLLGTFFCGGSLVGYLLAQKEEMELEERMEQEEEQIELVDGPKWMEVG